MTNINTAPANLEIDTSLEDDRWGPLMRDLSNDLDTICGRVLYMAAPALLNKELLELSLVLTNDNNIQVLNRDYRGKDKATNVLSFPQQDWEEDDMMPALPLFNLGDIIVALETIERESIEQEKSFSDHFTHMLVHGLLHLLGHDHIDDDEAREMEALEIEILHSLGIKNPYRHA